MGLKNLGSLSSQKIGNNPDFLGGCIKIVIRGPNRHNLVDYVLKTSFMDPSDGHTIPKFYGWLKKKEYSNND